MKTLTFEQLRINLTLTFDTLDEPIQIIKKGKIQGYIVKELAEHKEPEPKIVPVKSLDEPVKAIIKDNSEIGTAALRAIYKIKHPLGVCIKCQRYNRECICT
jgi:hypothetical protein